MYIHHDFMLTRENAIDMNICSYTYAAVGPPGSPLRESHTRRTNRFPITPYFSESLLFAFKVNLASDDRLSRVSFVKYSS